MSTLRRGLAILRLSLLYTLFCAAIFLLLLQNRSTQENALSPQIEINSNLQISTQMPSLGVNVQLQQYSPEERRLALNRLHETGFAWVRQRFDWGELEPQPNGFQWAQSDAIIQEIIAHNLVPIIVLDGSPPWARAALDAENSLAPPDDVASFANFAQEFAQRYQTDLRFYQLWDEPNIAPHWGERLIAPVEYARLLAAAGTAIREVDTDAIIIAAALAPTEDRGHTAIDETYFLQRLYAAQGPQESTSSTRLFDIVAIQPFGFGHAPSNQHNTHLNFQRAARIRTVMVAAGDAETPIWATSYGWNRQPNNTWQSVSPQQQSAFAVEAIEIAQQRWPWLAAMGWAIDQPATAAKGSQDGFAINPPLRRAFQQWATRQESRPMSAPSNAKPGKTSFASLHRKALSGLYKHYPRIFLLAALLLIGWRGWAAASLLPWAQWRSRYHKLPAWLHLSIWLALLYSYNLTVWPPLILLCLVAGTLLSIAHPQKTLYLATMLLPFHHLHKEIQLLHHQFALPPAGAMLICLLPVLLRYGCKQKIRQCRFNLWDGFAFTWLAVNLLSVRNVWHWPAYYVGLAEFALVPLTFYVAIRILIRTSARVQQLLWALTLGGALAALIGLAQWVGGGGTSADGLLRLVGPHFSPNHTALYLLRTLFVCGGLWAFAAFHADGLFFTNLWTEHLQMQVREGGRIETIQFAISALFIVIIFVALILTASRGALILGVPAGGMILWWHWLNGREDSRPMGVCRTRIVDGTVVKVIIAGAVLSALLLIWWQVPLWERFSNSATILRRVAIWQATIELWRDHIFVGVGPGGFFWRYPAYILERPLLDPNLRHPHNVWLEHLANWGILGAIWIVGLSLAFGHSLVSWLRGNQKGVSWLYVGVAAALVAAIAHGQVDAFGLLPDLAAWNWIALGLWSGRMAIVRQLEPVASRPIPLRSAERGSVSSH